MSSDVVIKVENLSKCYRIYDKPRDRVLQGVMPRLRHFLGVSPKQYCREFWALKDVSFEVKKGETVGIIGQNGSGKSTLLQMICGTLTPTSGSIYTTGTVAALLELGSGFNPEFTGRENVYMSCSLLGLTRTQTDDLFDYIAGFADIGDHLDQPVKTYSSGMMLRLAFAVQVAVETEVLIIDEALAVGDARFQLKCFKRLEELKSRGTTILFVSHATELIRSFCDYGLVLNKGKQFYLGDAKVATVKYLASIFPDQKPSQDNLNSGEMPELAPTGAVDSEECLFVTPDQAGLQTFGVGGATLDWLKFFGLDPPNFVAGGRDIRVRCQFSWNIDFVQSLIDSDGYKNDITLGVTVADNKGTYLFGCNGFDCNLSIDCLCDGQKTVEFNLVMPYLAEGDYFLGVAIALGDLEHHVQLKWYDNFLQLKCFAADKKVFGLFGVDYQMSLIDL